MKETDKVTLDLILDRNKAQPVGHGYIDIIVARANFKQLLSDLFQNGFNVKSISWWEWCLNGNDPRFGLGGPRSWYYDGWFSELSVDVDDIEIESTDDGYLIDKIVSQIESKRIVFPKGTASFAESDWLTPAFWLEVPEEWRNKYCA